jgi:hypothetical protein
MKKMKNIFTFMYEMAEHDSDIRSYSELKYKRAYYWINEKCFQSR